VSGFLLTWSPYAIVFFLSVFCGKDNLISPLTTFICACFAKSSVIWIPMLYMTTSTYFKFNFVDINSIDKQGQTTNIDVPNLSIENQNKKDFTPIDEHSNF
jgi:hypothetical protein